MFSAQHSRQGDNEIRQSHVPDARPKLTAAHISEAMVHLDLGCLNMERDVQKLSLLGARREVKKTSRHLTLLVL